MRRVGEQYDESTILKKHHWTSSLGKVLEAGNATLNAMSNEAVNQSKSILSPSILP